jgi:hypothetical protein
MIKAAYGTPRAVAVAIVCSVGLLECSVVLAIAANESIAWAVKTSLMAGVSVPIVLLAVFGVRAATIISDQGITVRGLRTRPISWPDIQEIQIEPNPIPRLQRGLPTQRVVVYGASGRRIVLPHMNERTFGDVLLGLEATVEYIDATWRQRRGPQWTPISEAQDAAAEARIYGVSSWWVGAHWAIGLESFLVATLFVLIIAGAMQQVSGALVLAILIGVPAVAFFTAAIVSKARRRRAMSLLSSARRDVRSVQADR